MPIDPNVLLKYGAVAALLGSIYALVWAGKMDADKYVLLVTSALAALGVGVAITN